MNLERENAITVVVALFHLLIGVLGISLLWALGTPGGPGAVSWALYVAATAVFVVHMVVWAAYLKAAAEGTLDV